MIPLPETWPQLEIHGTNLTRRTDDHSLHRIRLANSSDALFIADLQDKFWEQVGFLPPSVLKGKVDRGQILIGGLGNDEACYLYAIPSLSYAPHVATVVQAAVHMDVQRRGLGLDLLAALPHLILPPHVTRLQCWCRENLEANEFWRAAGFQPIGHRVGGAKRAKNQIRWALSLDGTPLTPGSIPLDPRPRSPGGFFRRRDEPDPRDQLTLFEPQVLIV